MVKVLNEFKLEIKKSRFIALSVFVDDVKEFNKYIEQLWIENKKAAHICFAYRISNPILCVKVNDDGEPKGTAGYPILNVMERNNMMNSAIIIIRYFGGIKLGSGPLLRAYSKCANQVLKY
ncbi:MAG: IMPACT family protein [Mycoplasma sp.]